MNRARAACLMLASTTAICLSGCSDPIHTVAATTGWGGSGYPHVWVGHDSNSVDMIQLTVSHQQVSGTMDETQLDSSATTTKSNHAGFTGTLDGQNLVITISEGLASGTASGTLNTDALTINVPQSDGTIAAMTFTPSTIAAYNQQVATLEGQASSNLGQQQQAAAQAAQASVNANLIGTAQDDANNLKSENDSFTNAKAVRDDVAHTEIDLTQEKQDAANGNGDNCYNVQVTVPYDASTNIGYDVNTSASYDVQTEQTGINSTRQMITKVQQDEAALQAAGLPATPGAQGAIAIAQTQDAQAITTTNTAIDELNSDLRDAYRIANSAGTGSCAGQGPGDAPAGLTHIS